MRIPIKLTIIALLVVVLAVPLLLVVSKIYERDKYSDQAKFDIARSWTGEQKILGPILVVPYTSFFEKREFDDDLKRYVMNKYEVDNELFILPDTLAGDVELTTEIRYRGIYKVPVYSSHVELEGAISNALLVELEERVDVIAIGQPYLTIAVDDMRGIAESPTLGWDTDSVAFLPGSNLAFQSNGIHAPLNQLEATNAKSYDFSVALNLRGMSSFRFAPVGNSSTVKMTSSWPHPRFEGLYLPTHREISGDGFTANWQTSAFATNITKKANDCAVGNCAGLASSYFGVQLVDPVDVYLQAQRASKYGILFIGLTFTAFFLFEVLKKLSIHPIQYSLVGLALTVFYLLLVSLAEHISFVRAYWIATAACSGLLGFYITYVLKSLKRGAAFGASIAGLYGVLYIIIQEEDYAFSMGASLVFIVLSGVMFVTRNIDWFQVSRGAFAKAEGGQDVKIEV